MNRFIVGINRWVIGLAVLYKDALITLLVGIVGIGCNYVIVTDGIGLVQFTILNDIGKRLDVIMSHTLQTIGGIVSTINEWEGST